MNSIERSMVTITKERYDFHIAEIERLREALQHIIRWHDQLSPADIAKAEAALKEGE